MWNLCGGNEMQCFECSSVTYIVLHLNLSGSDHTWRFSSTQVPFCLASSFLRSFSLTRCRKLSLLFECFTCSMRTLILLARILPLKRTDTGIKTLPQWVASASTRLQCPAKLQSCDVSSKPLEAQRPALDRGAWGWAILPHMNDHWGQRGSRWQSEDGGFRKLKQTHQRFRQTFIPQSKEHSSPSTESKVKQNNHFLLTWPACWQ